MFNNHAERIHRRKKREPIYQATQATTFTIAAMIKNTLQCLPHPLLCKIDAFKPVFGYCCQLSLWKLATQTPLNKKAEAEEEAS